MLSSITPVQSDDVLPSHADVTVVGGGIIGVATAYELARKGVSVVLLEKGCIAGEQSSRNWGWCRKQNRDEKEIPLIKFSVQRWAELSDELGEDSSFRPTGITYVSDNAADVEQWRAWVAMAGQYGLDSRMLDARQAKEQVPGASGSWLGGVLSPTDGRAEPTHAVSVLAKAARGLGVTIIQNCAVRGIERAAGRIDTVVTERGHIKTQAVVYATGAWTSLLCRQHGISLPQAGVYSTAMRTSAVPDGLDGGLWVPGLAIRKRLDGGYTLGLSGRGTVQLSPQGIRYAHRFFPTWRERRAGLKIRAGKSFFNGPEAFRSWRLDQKSPFEEIRTLDPGPDPALIAQARRTLINTYPALKDIAITNAWGGFIDNTPDGIPVISAVPAIPGLYLSTGYSGHGFGIGPGAGRVTADLVTNDTPVVDLAPFRYTRFIDGTRLKPPGMI